jgi:hypothetical protein
MVAGHPCVRCGRSPDQNGCGCVVPGRVRHAVGERRPLHPVPDDARTGGRQLVSYTRFGNV